MKKIIILLCILIGCTILTDCESRNDEEIERIGNLVNGT